MTDSRSTHFPGRLIRDSSPVRDESVVRISGGRLAERLQTPDAVLSRSDLAELGWPRRGVDSIMRHAGAIVLPGYSRPVVLVADYRRFLESHRFDGRSKVR